MARWEAFDFRRDTVAQGTLDSLPLDDLQRMRAIVFGRHGRRFERDSALAAWLASRPWYRPNARFDNGMLGATERANLDRIRRAEAARHPFIEPGDLAFWQDRPITQAALRQYTREEWEVLLLEVEALHGRRMDMFGEFDEEEADTLATWRYFHERYWYRPDDAYSMRRLSPRELANLDTLRAAELRQHAYRLEPGIMALLQGTVISDSMLRDNTLWELRILRNEVYAHRGRTFRTPWLAEYFDSRNWYEPRAGYSDTLLTDVERQNLLTIRRVEERKHAALATDTLDLDDFLGLEPEDARLMRYEIYARHGIVFSDPKVQRYFASLPWYRPNPAYRDALLTTLERKNVLAILEYEAKAIDGFRFYPPG